MILINQNVQLIESLPSQMVNNNKMKWQTISLRQPKELLWRLWYYFFLFAHKIKSKPCKKSSEGVIERPIWVLILNNVKIKIAQYS